MKIDFFLPQKNKILIFDKMNSHLLKIYLKKKNISELDVRRQRINLPIFFISLFKRYTQKISHNYYINYIKYVKPTLVITYIDNNDFFFQLKKNFPLTKFISIQNGVGLINKKIKKNNKWLCDYFFCYSDSYKKLYEKIIEGKVIVIGSFKNNILKPKIKIKKKILTFISQFRNNNLLLKNYYRFYFAERKIINILIPFCKRYGLKLAIACVDKKNLEEEKFFFKNMINEKNKLDANILEFNHPVDDFSSYRLIDSSELVVYVDSALGLQSFSRKNKTIAFSLRSQFLNNNKMKFGWPIKLRNRGDFWINYFDERKMIAILKKNLEISTQKWFKKNYQTHMFLKKDFGNKIFQKIINRYI